MENKNLSQHYKWIMKKQTIVCLEENPPKIDYFDEPSETEVIITDSYGLDVRIVFTPTFTGEWNENPELCEDGDTTIELLELEVFVDYMGDEAILHLNDFNKENRKQIMNVVKGWCR